MQDQSLSLLPLQLKQFSGGTSISYNKCWIYYADGTLHPWVVKRGARLFYAASDLPFIAKALGFVAKGKR